MKYKSILVTAIGGPEVIKIVEKDLLPPATDQARVRILATPVVQDDVAVRRGDRPWLPEPPFTPGYSILGEIDALGTGVDGRAIGERFVALTQYGGHAEYIYLDADQLVPVPESLDPAEAVSLILNYLVAYQVMHRIAGVKADDKVLIIGASGGCGTAFLQLGALAGLQMYGLASTSKHHILRKYGAIPIDYREQNFVEVMRAAEPAGLDFVFNGMGEEYLPGGMAVLRRGGALVHYGAPQSKSRFWLFLARYIYYNLLPNGKYVKGYGTHRLGVGLFQEDWNTLFNLLAAGKIEPVIAACFPILEAVKAYEMLESGRVAGNIVLLSPDLLITDQNVVH